MKKCVTLLFDIMLSIVMIISFVACGTVNSNNLTSNSESEKPNIQLSISKEELTIGIEEEYTLYASISPITSSVTVNWSSSNEDVVDIDADDTTCVIHAKSEGVSIIQVTDGSGNMKSCWVTVIQKVGSVTGTVTYKYNDYIGHKPDTGTDIILIKDIEEPGTLIKDLPQRLPDELGLGLVSSSAEDGIYGTTVDGNGNYIFEDIPIGDYYIVLISKATNDNPMYVGGLETWGIPYCLFTEKGKNNALLTAKVYRTRNGRVTIKENKSTTFSYDFGITYM